MKITERKGSFIKRFEGPGEETDIICFRFWQAVVASGCPGECSYCFLQGLSPYEGRLGIYSLKGTIFENLSEIVPQVRAWLKNHKEPAGLIVGENQDGLAFEQPYKRLIGVTPLELLIPLFDKENSIGHTLIVLSKFTSTQYAENLGPSRNVVFSWSLSLPTISERYEKKVAPLEARLKKAEAMKKEGYRIRFRLDALAPIPGWRDELHYIVTRINDAMPEMLTVGALRATDTKILRQASERNGRDAGIFDFIATKDASGFKYRTDPDFQKEAFATVREKLAPGIELGLCKEDVSLWQHSHIQWQGCHCLHGRVDQTTTPRLHLLTRTIGPDQKKVVFCPSCGRQHIDEGKWAVRPHKTHQCQFCMNEWDPFPYRTIGVAD